jgi:hypothetical protein
MMVAVEASCGGLQQTMTGALPQVSRVEGHT